ncbi:MAG TPA: ABC transporter permease [Acidimicrobiales bacterium]|jgi:ABC-2 type transport system permease protein/oleandomycin transport system permease protein
MTTLTTDEVLAQQDTHTSLSWAVLDTLAVARRNLIALVRTPTTLMFSTVQPIIFVLMFRYVFGGAIKVPHGTYVDYLMPGIFVQTVTFGAINTGVGLATDLQTGLIERFRSLPMARSAVLGGRTLADMVRNVGVVILLVVMGYIVGFRVTTNVPEFLVAIALLLLFGLAMSWVVALIGLATGNAEAAQAATFPIMALLVFASNAFVPTRSMPRLLRAYANHQPVSATISAVRALSNGGPILEHLAVAVAWAIGIIAVFAVLATQRYRRAA